ncbi:MAG: peptide ABC transporter substrate-binding protein [Lachnospiraceae bacterium]|nr:peptide ABC transporter substrate-binding protein [Lachnospiraceae bacterium]
MRKISKRVFALALAMSTLLTACGGNGGSNATNTEATNTEVSTQVVDDRLAAEVITVDMATYDAKSAEVYNAALSEFITTYEAAKAVDNVSERQALMAIAEAKLMESAVMLPTTTRGGNYAISRVVPYSVPYSLWGNDPDRFYTTIVATEPITKEHRDVMKAKWTELKGTGTYEEWAKSFLAENGYSLKDSYSYGYTGDPETWDALATSKAVDSEMIVQTYDGLVVYDMEGTMQPALAESWSVSEDGLTYTFNIRQGVKWVDSQGREVGTVTADDFVAGMQHMLDAMGGLEYLVQGVIVGVNEYIAGEITDFAQVGVKAVDEYTLTYTLEAPTSYFMTMLGYNVFAPMNRDYYVSQGGKFGAEYDPTAADYLYGTTKDNIAYCGPFLCTNATASNTIAFEANPTYWNKDAMNVTKLTALFNDGTEATKAYKDAMAGTIDGAGLNSSSLELAKSEGVFDTLAYISSTDATSYMGFYNLNRAAFANTNDPTTVVSTQTVTDAARTNAAMNNVHFRRAISFAVDRAAYNAQKNGEDLKLNSLRNSYTPGHFVFLEEEVTVDINGTATTFPAQTPYGAIMQAQIDADGVTMTVYKEGAENGSDGFDGWFNPEAAVAELELAIADLAAAGVEVSAENPIVIDYPFASNSETYTNVANVYKQSVESVLGGKVVVNLVTCVDYNEWYYTGYYTSYGYEANYDMYDLSGWGPDYGDPQTYLDTFLPDYAGYMAKCCGIF